MTCYCRLYLLFCLLAAACGGIPQPVPIPAAPKQEYLRGSEGLSTPTPLKIIGLPGAVAGAGKVSISGRQNIEVQSTAAGSFVATIDAVVGDELLLRFEDSPTTSYVVLPPLMTMGVKTPEFAAGNFSSTPEPGNVWVRVTANDAPAGVFAINTQNGAMATDESRDAQGVFELQLRGTAGDVVHVYIDLDPLAPPLETIAQQ